MTDAEIIIEYLEAELYRDHADGAIGEGDNLLDRGPIDSLGVVALVDFLQARFSVEIRPGEVTIKNFKSVATMLALIERKRGDGEASP